MFCARRIEDATQVHLALDAGNLIFFAFAWGPSQMQSSRGAQANDCTATNNVGDIPVPSGRMASMAALNEWGWLGSRKRCDTR